MASLISQSHFASVLACGRLGSCCNVFQEAFQVGQPSCENFLSTCIDALITPEGKCLFPCPFPHQSADTLRAGAVSLAQGRYLVILNNCRALPACPAHLEPFTCTQSLKCQNNPISCIVLSKEFLNLPKVTWLARGGTRILILAI